MLNIIGLLVLSTHLMALEGEGAEDLDSLEETTTPAAVASPTKGEAVSSILSVGARFDASYSGGGAVAQGFALPSARVTVFGTALKHVDYRFSMGQTREYSTAQLPQLLPTEAFIHAHTHSSEEESSGMALRFRLGMFTPLMNPIWTPDLSEIDMPDYHETHKALFLNRDLGAEVSYEPIKDRIQIGVGAFNGTGIFALNTNNGKAFNGYLRLQLPTEKFKLSAGVGSYSFRQSNVGSINFKSAFATDVFASIEYLPWQLHLSVDGFVSQFEDSTRSLTPVGGAGMMNVCLVSWLRFFARYEHASRSPLVTGTIRHLQFGPEFLLTEKFKTFVTYQHLESGGTTEKIVLIRVRLTV